MNRFLSSAFLKTIAILLLFTNLLLFTGNIGSMVLVAHLENTYGGEDDALHEAWTRIFFHKAYNLSADYANYSRGLDSLEDSLCYAVITTGEGKFEDIDFSDSYYLYKSDDFSSEKTGLLFAMTRIEVLDGISGEEASSDNYLSSSYIYYSYEETLFPMLFQAASFGSDNADIFLFRDNNTSIFEYYIYDYSTYYYSNENSIGSLTIEDGENLFAEIPPETDLLMERSASADASESTDSVDTSENSDSADTSDVSASDTDPGNSDSALLYYWVVGSVRTDYTDSTDEFAIAASLLDIVWSFSDAHVLWLTLTLSVCLICIIYLCLSAGHHRSKNGITLTWIDKTPYGILVIITAVVTVGLTVISVNMFISDFLYYSMSYLESLLSVVAAILLFFICYLFVCLLAASTIVRLKARSFWRYTLSEHLLHLARRILRKASINLKDLPSHLPLAFTVSFTFILLTAADCILLVLSGMSWFYLNPIFLIVYLILKAIELLVLIFVGLQADRIRKGGQRIAAGDLSEPIPTDGLFGEFKRHAENINKVGDCISSAVEDRMKSEHFKTELITNVSHDIKTPLTSIINYVDLMKKQNITDPTLLEYMDVLDRQSSRLKKLIEDLMEASKASTGNLEVHLERCNVSVLFAQIIGEFDERAAANNLSFVENLPKESIYVLADGRHLWRVLENLINNACKYSVPGTRIYIDLTISDINYATITIRNISKSQLNISSEELLERFVRGDSSRNTEGSGLGLSIAQSLTALMHGTLGLEIDGDLFKVILKFPRTEAPKPDTDFPELPGGWEEQI